MRLAWAQLRRRPGRYLSLFFAVAVAVALTVATSAIAATLQSTVGSFFAKPYTAADAVVTVRGSNDQVDPVVAAACAAPGVQACAFDRVAQVGVRDPHGVYKVTALQAIDPATAPGAAGGLQWRAVDGQLPTTPWEIATTDDTPLGSTLPLASFSIADASLLGEPRADEVFTVVGHVEAAAKERLIGSSTLFVAPSAFEMLDIGYSTGEVRLQGVPGTSGGDLVRQLTGILPPGTQISTADDAATAGASSYLTGRDRYFLLLAVFTATVAAVAALVIVSAFAVVAGARRREFALLKSLGATPGQLYRSVAGEALVLGIAGGALGAPTGLWLAQVAGRHAADVGVQVPLDEVSLAPAALVVVAALGTMVTIASALPAARSAIRADVVASLWAHDAPPRGRAGALLRAAAGLLLLLLGGALLLGGGSLVGAGGKRAILVACGSGALIVGGLVALGGVILPQLMAWLHRVLSFLPAAQLGMAYIGRQAGRAASIVGIVLAGTALVAAVTTGQEGLETHLNAKAQGQQAADMTITSMTGAVMPDELQQQLRDLPGVTTVLTPRFAPVIPLTPPGTKGAAGSAGTADAADAAATQTNAAATAATAAGAGTALAGAHSTGIVPVADVHDAVTRVLAQEGDGAGTLPEGLPENLPEGLGDQLPEGIPADLADAAAGDAAAAADAAAGAAADAAAAASAADEADEILRDALALQEKLDKILDRPFVLSREEAADAFRGAGGAGPGELVVGLYSKLRTGYRDGQTIDVDILDTPVQVRLRFSTTALESFIDPGVIPLPAEDLPLGDATFVRLDGPAVQPADGPAATAVLDTLAASGERYSVAERFTTRNDILASTQRLLTLATLMTIIAALVAIVGAVNTVTLAVRERRRDYAGLRAIGMTSPGILGTLLVELVALAVPAAVIGTAAGGVLGARIADVVAGGTQSHAIGEVLTGSTGAHLLLIILAAVVGIMFCGVVASARGGRLTPTAGLQ
ncbi:ABC transporter permease [Corynebacterium sp. 13CS0277]|uniref:ABC transporter permease n=1 Tax=Corynebacterium sp. 13CS0277 TaxID=2071994 RepID=UPI0011B1E58F|nr:ABC transporter permease [Corynebacterium sp. 13CS0277]